MPTNTATPSKTFTTVHVHFMDGQITTAMHFRVSAADLDEAIKISAERCIPGFVVTGTRLADPNRGDKSSPWLN